ncbi:transcriptional regulator [Izhakiella australiensis]|uniref:Transcriptional regulator n=1 Tax=Izhakiella australiensis TaxID=1926881 RepID=A0A1S8YMP9_9GAMM|nr:DeoR/GlpR family DNA-binding transcription regulator [Izhakiella australiensis]OON40087.1 transcriptional regulator [Izhakiella australiensis]
MKQATRQIYILEQIKVHGEVSSKDLAEKLNVSTMTISRDLKELTKSGNIELTHGGAVLHGIDMSEHSMSIKEGVNIEGKKKIARYCKSLIKPGDSIFIETGTTTLFVAKEIFRNTDSKFYTNSLLVHNALSKYENILLYSVPGKYRALSKGFLGIQTINYVQDFSFDIAFIGTEGISVEGDITLPNEEDAYTKKAIIKNAKKVIIVADASKFGLMHKYRAAKLDDIDMIVTDLPHEDPFFQQVTQAGKVISVAEIEPDAF